MLMSTALFFCVLLLPRASAIGSPFFSNLRGFKEYLPIVGPDAPEPNEALYIDMPLDHFGNDSRTFPNRYWINDTYYKPGGPVFLYDVGEEDAEPLLPYNLQEYHGLSATMRLAKRYGGLAILWEHRYYGDSLPFPVTDNTTADEWKYLTTEQTLEDVVFFTNSFPSNSDHSLKPPIHPSTTPWVWLGGSYPGMRGAFMRIRNPEIIYATWASSAPVQIQVIMPDYYEAAERSLTRNCSADWVAVTKFVDDTLKGSSNDTVKTQMKYDLLKARLTKPGAGNLTMRDAAEASFLDATRVLMDPLKFFQYYGFEASVLPFCNVLETRNFTIAPIEAGLISVTDVESVFRAFLTAVSELDYNSIPGAEEFVTDRSWMFQYCTEYGFYRIGDPNNNKSIESSFFSQEHFQEECNVTFPGGVPPSPAVENVNKYGGWNMSPANVFWSNGEFDPWRTQGLASFEWNSPQRQSTTSIPQCNVAPADSSFFGITYKNQVHVTDLRVLLTPDDNHRNFKTVGFYSPVDPEPFYAGLKLFELALDEWLPCFEPSGGIGQMDSLGAQGVLQVGS